MGNDNDLTHTTASDSSMFDVYMSPTPSGGRRRHRDSNEFDLNLEDDIVITRPAGTIPITPATRKRLKVSCKDAARLFDVDPHQLVMFAEVCYISNYLKSSFNVQSSTVVHMLIHVEAHLLKIENMFKKEKFEVLFKSTDFRVCFSLIVQPFLTNILQSGLQDRLMVALLSPGIPAYVTDVTTRMLVSPAIFSFFFFLSQWLSRMLSRNNVNSSGFPRIYLKTRTIVLDWKPWSVSSSLRARAPSSKRPVAFYSKVCLADGRN